MSIVLQPWHLLVLILANWLNRQQQSVIDYHRERNHQGLNNRLVDPSDVAGEGQGRICCRERLGGTLKYYHRKAA